MSSINKILDKNKPEGRWANAFYFWSGGIEQNPLMFTNKKMKHYNNNKLINFWMY